MTARRPFTAAEKRGIALVLLWAVFCVSLGVLLGLMVTGNL